MDIYKSRDGWCGRSYIDLGDEEVVDLGKTVTSKKRILVTTSKSSRGGLRSSAMFIRQLPSGTPGITMEQHKVFHDFSATVETSSARCTEKAVREMHQRAMAMADTIKAACEAHYAEKRLAA